MEPLFYGEIDFTPYLSPLSDVFEIYREDSNIGSDTTSSPESPTHTSIVEIELPPPVKRKRGRPKRINYSDTPGYGAHKKAVYNERIKQIKSLQKEVIENEKTIETLQDRLQKCFQTEKSNKKLVDSLQSQLVKEYGFNRKTSIELYKLKKELNNCQLTNYPFDLVTYYEQLNKLSLDHDALKLHFNGLENEKQQLEVDYNTLESTLESWIAECDRLNKFKSVNTNVRDKVVNNALNQLSSDCHALRLYCWQIEHEKKQLNMEHEKLKMEHEMMKSECKRLSQCEKENTLLREKYERSNSDYQILRTNLLNLTTKNITTLSSPKIS